MSKLKDLYINEMIDMDEYKRDYEQLKTKLDELTAEVVEKDEITIDIDGIKNLLSKSTEDIYQTLTAEDKRKFWHSFIDRIVYHSKYDMDIFFK